MSFTKGLRKHLEVSVAGKRIAGRTATDVFVNALCEMGLERIAALASVPTLSGSPLVSLVGPPRAFRRQGDWFIATHSSTAEKHSVLERVASRLGVQVHVSVTEPDEKSLT